MKLEFTPLGGLNNYDNYSRLGPTEVEDCSNLLFEKQKCFNRPGVTQVPLTGVVGPLVFGENVSDSALPYNIIIGASNRIFYYPGTEITAAGSSAVFGTNIYNNACCVIGIIILGNNPGGLVQWSPSTGPAYTIVAGAPFRYVTGHQGRAVAAYQNSGGSVLTNARTFAWSKPGDVTDWLETDGSAGQEAIAEIEDQITGLGTLHNIVVIPHERGIHLAYATGTLPEPYNIQPFIKRGAGCYYPSTSAWSDELYFFVSQEDVYYFDLTNVTPIGGKIRNALLSALEAGIIYKGYVTRQQYGNQPRLRYNLMPLNSATSPHYVYDILEGKWSQHFYSVAAEWAWNFSPFTTSPDLGISFADGSNPPVQYLWQAGTNCEQIAYFTRYMGVLESQELDFLVNDLLVRTVDHGSMAVTVTLLSTLGDTQSTATATKSLGGANTGRWTRQFLTRGTSDLRAAGQEFILTVSVTAGVNFECDYVALIVSDQPSGEYRGY